MSKKPLKLNIGCGENKIKGFVNIDGEKSCNPDIVHNFVKKPLPYKSNVVDEIVFFHTIEHIQKKFHHIILSEMYRILKPGGKLYISYPNFWECAQRWKQNYLGQKRFWEATLFGRQLYKLDHHVCAMDPDELEIHLKNQGYTNVVSKPEPVELYNTVTFGIKGPSPLVPYERQLGQADHSHHLVKR